jgi:hypothetical protein
MNNFNDNSNSYDIGKYVIFTLNDGTTGTDYWQSYGNVDNTHIGWAMKLSGVTASVPIGSGGGINNM